MTAFRLRRAIDRRATERASALPIVRKATALGLEPSASDTTAARRKKR